MLKKDVMQQVMMAWTRPEIAVEVLKRFYENVYQRNLEKSANLFNTEEEAKFNCDFDFKSEGREVNVNFITLKNIITQTTNQDSDYFNITDKDTNEEVLVSATELSQQIADINDVNYLNMKFAQCINDSNRFLSEVSAYLPSLSANTRMVYDNMASAISNSDVLSKIAFLNQASGLEQTLNGSLSYTTNTMQSDYTGIAPGQAFINSIDVSWIDEIPVLGWLNKADKAIKKLQKEARGWLTTQAKKLFNFAKSEYKEIVENPNDISILNGEHVGVINVPAKFSVYLDNVSDGRSLIGVDTWGAMFGNSDTGILSSGPNYYVLKPNFSDEGCIMSVERYVQPINPYKLYQLMKSIPGVQNSGYSNMSINDFITFLTYANSIDLRFDKDAAENDIYYGLLFSEQIDTLMHQISAKYRQDFVNAADKIEFFNSELDPTLAGSLAQIAGSADLLTNLFESLEAYANNDSGAFYIISYGKEYLNFDKNRTVSNADWIRAITTISIPADNVNGTTAINIIDNGNMYSDDGVYIFNSTTPYYGSPLPAAAFTYGQLVTLVFTGFALCPNLSEQFGSLEGNITLWAPLCTPLNGVSSDLSIISLSTTIKTDSDNLEVINKLLINTIVTITIVVAAVFALKSAAALRRTTLKASLNMSALSNQYQRELLSGQPSADTFNQLMVARRKYRLLSTVAGSMSSNANDLLLNAIDNTGATFYPKQDVDLNPIVSLIK